ncbi:short chain dehydrogenase [Ceratobasidium sp. AG-Ba]|nr:short chain dehydrogenase [Ceratobasidium sp. AG-Ba]QRV89384.1 short chain dehydrogenase [Ceratobasidium sp. AG-Ba]QRW03600.1 short chain dehydrogenase [Ceratobasidium sp. AG-Ba]
MTDHLLTSKLFDVKDKVVLVTGGGTGIGLMIASTLATNGAKVYIGGRRAEKVESSAKEHNEKVSGQIVPIELDVANKESIQNAVKVISKNDGHLDVLVNNAGITGPQSPWFAKDDAPELKDPEKAGTKLFGDQSFEEWGDLYKNNVASIFFVTSAFLGLLHKASAEHGPWTGTVINISSLNGHLKVSQGKFCYNATKAANIHLTKMLATEYALKNIPVRVNTIAPGFFPSEMTGSEGHSRHGVEGKDADENSGLMRPIPINRSGTDADIGGAVLFLASSASAYVLGQTLFVDGGVIATHPASA